MIAHVLLVEGDLGLRKSLERFLAFHLIDVDSVDSASECLSQLRKYRYDALVLSWDLDPDVGIGVLATVHGMLNLPVILTTSERANELAALLKPPVVHILSKPFSSVALLQRILNTTRAAHRGVT